jgi:hypothetical protein
MEHNPDKLSPKDYEAPKWRLLNVGEKVESGVVQCWDYELMIWRNVYRNGEACENVTYRRLV